ncbi:MAG: FkbM family methyltransferase [Candidatus Absconditabacteria bacterium]|nr:FkbM family methyltransferase [Candidatus Absconditabacteria bacterium]MDD3868324.1 FkbM family methyltransferase [Candidatus Absconditabacteria bacterium]MDD4713986.1 FkbM family methyltransferase [Candidatus Absconditabacteria bacterium]
MKDYNQALHYEIFVKEEYACMKQEILNAKTIFDIGGHMGYFSEWCREIGSEAEIHYFEPLPFLIEEAMKCLKDDPKIIWNTFGIGAKEEEIRFLINREKTMQSSSMSSFLNPQGEEMLVQMKNMKQYLSSLEKGRGNPELAKKEEVFLEDIVVKMDIEGMEFEVLESWGEEIFERIGAMIMEVHLFDPEKIERYQELKEKMRQHFPSLEEWISPYNQGILLVKVTK